MNYYLYSNIIGPMTLNTHVNLLLNYAKNHLEYQENEMDFYKIVYAVAEKEKYIQQKYGYPSRLLEQLDSKSMQKLKDMFNKRMGFNETLVSMDYLTVLDPEYEMFFDKCNFKKEIVITNIPKKKEPKLRVESRGVIKKRYYLVSSIDNRIINCPLDLRDDNLIIKQVFDFFIVKNSHIITIYDREFTKLIDYVGQYDVDYKNEYILLQLYNENIVRVYDRNFKYINSFDQWIMKFPSYEVNDGVISASNSERNLYFDYLNNKVVDSFEFKQRVSFYANKFLYSEGLYNYIDKNGLMGYKDLEGNVVIEPKFSVSTPFFHNFACLLYRGEGYFLLDKYGELHPFNTVDDVANIAEKIIFPIEMHWYHNQIYHPDSWRFEVDLFQQAYFAKVERRNIGCIVADTFYNVDNDTPILELNIEKIEDTKELKKMIRH